MYACNSCNNILKGALPVSTKRQCGKIIHGEIYLAKLGYFAFSFYCASVKVRWLIFFLIENSSKAQLHHTKISDRSYDIGAGPSRKMSLSFKDGTAEIVHNEAVTKHILSKFEPNQSTPNVGRICSIYQEF